jgi:hypothetical protein
MWKSQPVNDPEFHKRLAELGYFVKDGVVTELAKDEADASRPHKDQGAKKERDAYGNA